MVTKDHELAWVWFITLVEIPRAFFHLDKNDALWVKSSKSFSFLWRLWLPAVPVRCAQLAWRAAQVAEAATRFPRWGLGVQVSWESEGGPRHGGGKHWPIAHLNGRIPGASSIAWVPLDGERKERFSRCPAGKIWLWETSFRTYCLSEGCHSRWVLSKQREQGFEPENQQSLDNIVIGPCLFRGGWKPNWER